MEKHRKLIGLLIPALVLAMASSLAENNLPGARPVILSATPENHYKITPRELQNTLNEDTRMVMSTMATEHLPFIFGLLVMGGIVGAGLSTAMGACWEYLPFLAET